MLLLQGALLPLGACASLLQPWSQRLARARADLTPKLHAQVSVDLSSMDSLGLGGLFPPSSHSSAISDQLRMADLESQASSSRAGEHLPGWPFEEQTSPTALQAQLARQPSLPLLRMPPASAGLPPRHRRSILKTPQASAKRTEVCCGSWQPGPSCQACCPPCLAPAVQLDGMGSPSTRYILAASAVCQAASCQLVSAPLAAPQPAC